MVTEAVLEKRIKKLKQQLSKAREAGEQGPPPERTRKIRKRLKHNQRKLACRAAQRKRGEAAPAKAQ